MKASKPKVAPQEINEYIRENFYRKEGKLSWSQLAEDCGLTTNAVRHRERAMGLKHPKPVKGYRVIDGLAPRPPRIAFFDIETAPILGRVWGLWEENVIKVEESWYMLSFSVKFLGDTKVKTYALPDFKGYKPGSTNDYELVKKLWEVFDEADILVAHNGDRFDIPKANVRFAVHGMLPPSPYKSLDTKKMAKAKFKFDSNKLADLATSFKLENKMQTGGYALWDGCMKGDKRSWATMKKYNAQDVVVLEQLYLKLRPWVTTHPNLSVYEEKVASCSRCQSENIALEGFQVRGNSKREQYHCGDCGAWTTAPMSMDQKIRIS